MYTIMTEGSWQFVYRYMTLAHDSPSIEDCLADEDIPLKFILFYNSLDMGSIPCAQPLLARLDQVRLRSHHSRGGFRKVYSGGYEAQVRTRGFTQPPGIKSGIFFMKFNEVWSTIDVVSAIFPAESILIKTLRDLFPTICAQDRYSRSKDRLITLLRYGMDEECLSLAS